MGEKSASGVRLGNELLRRGVLSEERLRQALVEHAKTPGGAFDELLVRLGFATREQIAEAGEPLAEFGKYELLHELGRGGMGVVYEARDRALGRSVALKLMLGRRGPAAAGDEERFTREARLTAALPPHPGIVGVYDAGTVGDRRFIAMELVRGTPFTAWRARAPLRAQVEVLRDAARALQHAHAHGVIHRDLKPDNILVDGSGAPRITDFGLAKAVGEDARVSLTGEGMVVGTPAYMSPEQAQGLRSVDGRTDVWSLGVLLYEALTGRQPFQGQTAVEILMKAAKNAAPSPSRVVSKEAMAAFDPALEKVCLKALAKKPAERYPSAGALADELDRWLRGDPVTAPPSSVRLKNAPPAAPRPSKALPLALALAAAVALGVVALLLVKPPPPKAVEPPPARPAAALSLLPLAKPSTDALRGRWSPRDGGLASEEGGLAILYLPHEPPGEYDVRVEFTPLGAEPDINVIGVADGRPFQWYVGAQGSTWYGFGRIDGDPAFGHPSGTRQKGLLGRGKRHVTLLEVRKGRITGYLDGRRLASLDTARHLVGMTEDMRSPSGPRLGLVTWNNPTLFHAVDLLTK